MSRSRRKSGTRAPESAAAAARAPVRPATTARPPARRTAPPSDRSSGFPMVALIFIGVPIAFAGTPTLLLIVVGMLPTLVALVVDRSRDKLAAITVGPMNVAGLLLPLTGLWFGPNDIAQALSILSNLANAAIVYGAAAVGWGIYFTVPGLVARVLVDRRRQRIMKMTVELKTLVDDWGEDVKGRPVVPPPS